MPAWTLANLMSYATTALGNRTDITLSDASFWVNEAGREVWDSLPFDQQEKLAVSSTTVNEDKITLPADFQELLAVSNTSVSNTLLDPINLDQTMAFSDASGTPTHYALYSTWLELRPTPDSAYSLQLRYRAQWSDMTTTTSVPSVSTRYRRAIMFKGAELLAQNVTFDADKAAEMRNAYVSYMHSVPSDRALRMREQHAMGMSLGLERGQKLRPSTSSFDRDVV